MIWFWSVPLIIVFVFGFVVFRGAPYIPSQKKYIKLAFNELYQLAKSDVLVDIGSGDGVVLREASRIGARAVGFEINPILVFLSRFLSRGDKRVSVHLADFWLANLPDDTTIVYIFSVGRDMKKMMKWMQKETTRIGRPISLISFGFGFKNMKVYKITQPYYLYVFHPLHQVKPQV
jgi:SAM-dependent methyltransferase